MGWIGRRFHISFGIFCILMVMLLAIHGSRLVFTGDEGILLEPAQRVAMGQRPYVDFFAYMSPGSYWIQAAIFRLFGFTMLAGRLMTILDFSLECALLFWLVARFATIQAASIATTLFFIFQFADPTFLTAQHRWDSGALAMLSIVMTLIAYEGQGRWRWLVSGALLAMAALCTPTMAVIGLITCGWLLAGRRVTSVGTYLCGGTAIGISAVLYMWHLENLQAFVDQMVWLRANYSEVNIVPYGAVLGGYQNLFQDSSGFALALQLGLVFCIALPATLPPFAVSANLIQIVRGKVIGEERSMLLFLLVCTLGFVFTAYPRPDVMHLAFIATLPYALTAIWLSRWCSLRLAGPAVAGVAVFAAFYIMSAVIGLWGTTTLPFAVGTLRVPKSMEPELTQLVSKVGRQQSLFVHPYMPLFYFLTQASNPTRFAYLAPGLMKTREERMVLEDLKKKPPEYVMFLHLSREEFLRVFPNGSGMNVKFTQLEDWLELNYKPLDPAVTVQGYQLLRRVSGSPLARLSSQ